MKDKIICIGRQYGSGGREIGELLARELRIPCYDKLIVSKASEHSHLTQNLLQAGDETPVNSKCFLTGNFFVDSAAIANAFYSESQIVYAAERKSIEELVSNGPCILIGRCASAQLRDRCISVFLYADEKDRLQRIRKRNSLDERAARQRMKRIDKMRRKYFNFYSDTAWGQPESYDIMVSSSRYGIEGCVRLLQKAVTEIMNNKETAPALLPVKKGGPSCE